MVCFSRRHGIGDKHFFSDKDDFLLSLVNNTQEGYIEDSEEFISEVLCKNIKRSDYKSSSECSRAVDDAVITYLESKGYVILPIFLYDHSGITISTGAFNCQWDSGQIGWIYADPKTICKEYGTYSLENREKAKGVMEAEVKVYDQYIQGDVYGFRLEKKVMCEHCNHMEYEEVDSCWGFYGDDWKENGILDHLGWEHEDSVNKL